MNINLILNALTVYKEKLIKEREHAIISYKNQKLFKHYGAAIDYFLKAKRRNAYIEKVEAEIKYFESLFCSDNLDRQRQTATEVKTMEYLPDEIVSKLNIDVLQTLTPREEKIVRMFYGFYCPKGTTKEIAKHFQVSEERINQILEKAARKLKHPSRLKLMETV
jgi:RNA polymerase sigma factor (sigma-70 family)